MRLKSGRKRKFLDREEEEPEGIGKESNREFPFLHLPLFSVFFHILEKRSIQ